MRIIGSIVKVNPKAKLIAIKGYNRLIYFYFQSSQMSIFKRYLYEGVYIDLEYDETKTFKKIGIEARIVDYVHQVYAVSRFKRTYFYDQNTINTSLSKFLSSLGNIMFLDLEMTMPSYGYYGKEFQAEVVQAGYLLVDGNGEEICRYSNYVKPVLQKYLSRRTQKFLNIDIPTFESKAISYNEFYEEFDEILSTYHPTIVVYGKNDSIILKNSYRINHLPSLQSKTRFVNLCKLIKNYYNLKNDAGLFKLYQIYYQNEDLQIHDAFNDSEVTKAVFKAFKDDVNHITNNYSKIRKELD